MKVSAARLRDHGAPLKVEEVELPAPGPDEALVELRFGGVNPVDRYMAEGRVAPEGTLPRTLGSEASGLLDGRPVLVAGGGFGAGRDGVWAAAAVVPVGSVIELPSGVELRDAAAMGVAGLTAYKVVRDLAQVGPEDRVLVLGASGGVGTMILSLAKAVGATIWGQTGSESKVALIKDLGADQVIAGGPDELAHGLSSLEPTVVFDPLGDGYVQPVLDSVSPRARIVSFGTSAGAEVELNMRTLYRKGISLMGYAGLIAGPDERRLGLNAALQALAAGDLRVTVDDVLPLEKVNEAFQRLLERKVQGKLLLALQ